MRSVFTFHETLSPNNDFAQLSEHQNMHTRAVAGDGRHDGIDAIERAAIG
jgi:hypothetical protein